MGSAADGGRGLLDQVGYDLRLRDIDGVAAGASVSEIAASHAVYVSQPQVVADLIKQAAAAAGG